MVMVSSLVALFMLVLGAMPICMSPAKSAWALNTLAAFLTVLATSGGNPAASARR